MLLTLNEKNTIQSVNSALLIAASPLESARIALKLQHILACLAVLKPKDSSITLDEHHASTWLDFFMSKVANSSLWHFKHLIER